MVLVPLGVFLLISGCSLKVIHGVDPDCQSSVCGCVFQRNSSFLCSSSITKTNVKVTCNILATDVDIMLFTLRSCPQVVDSILKLDDFETNWKTMSHLIGNNDSATIVLSRPNKAIYNSIMLHFKVGWISANSTATAGHCLWYALLDGTCQLLYSGILLPNDEKHEEHKIHKNLKRASPSTPVEVPSRYLMVANQFYLHLISLDGSRMRVAVSGLEDAVSVDYNFRMNSIYWIDSGQQAIMQANLNGSKQSVLLDHGLTQPGSLSVDWISNKIYWTDVRRRAIGVCDLTSGICKHSLISIERNIRPRGLVVDPTVRVLYWTEWDESVARIRSASMDGSTNITLVEEDLMWPYAITVDVDSQTLYWADSYFNKIECGNVDGTGRRLVISTGIEDPFDITLFGDMLYISDSALGILATNKSGDQPVQTIYNKFCNNVHVRGIQVVAKERQLLASNPCEDNNGGCNHLCLQRSRSSSGYSCACPDDLTLESGFTCSTTTREDATQLPSTTVTDSCQQAGYTDCCGNGACQAGSAQCFCDSDCYLYDDCCKDIENICTQQNNESSRGYLLVSSGLYVTRMSVDGARIKNLISSVDEIKSIDYDYKNDHMYWSTSANNINRLWQSRLDGSGVIAILSNGQQEIGDVATDWITNKLYWTESGQHDQIQVLDIASLYLATVVNTGLGSYPKGLTVDPVRRWLYWSDRGNVPKIERASMDGSNRTEIHNTDLQRPTGLTIDYVQQVLYWTDERSDRIECSNVDGSNRRIVGSQSVYQPFAISVYGDPLYFTDLISGVNTLNSMGTVNIIFDGNRLCNDPTGIKVVNIERQPSGDNPCHSHNGGCSHLCLLSSTEMSGYHCACPDRLVLGVDGHVCLANGTSAPVTRNLTVEHGTCTAAGYSNECCASGTCRGLPPTCFCDSNCHLFQDCCDDVPPSCQPDVDVLEFVSVLSNVTLALGPHTQNLSRQFQCSVRASRATTFQWTFTNTSQFSASEYSLQYQITNAHMELDNKYSILSTDYSSLLTINDIQFSDAGIYTCTASIGSGISPITTSALCVIEVTPSMPLITGNHIYDDMETMHLTCTVEAFPQPSIIWLFRNFATTRVMLNTSRVSVSSTSSFIKDGRPYARSDLLVAYLASQDTGEYLCEVRTDGLSTQQIINITINVTANYCEHTPCLNGGTCVHHNNGKYHCICRSTYTGQNCSQRQPLGSYLTHPMFINVSMDTVTTDIGTSVSLTCEAIGHPPPSIQWYKDGVIIPWETQRFLYINEVMPDDRGSYSCKAVNSEGTAESGQTLLSLVGIYQYLAELQCNASLDFEKTIIEQIIAMEHLYVYSVTHSGMSSNLSLLVTVLTRNMSQSQNETRHILTSGLLKVCAVNSVIRFDGCETKGDAELNLGESVVTPCPCSKYLAMLPEIKKQKGLRMCGGSYTSGAQLQNTDYTQCATAVNETSHSLCQALVKVLHDPLKAIDTVFNITDQEQQLNTTVDITLLSVVIQLLADEASMNMKVADGYLRIIDYYQTLHPYTLNVCQTLTNSSTRILDSLEQFVSSAITLYDDNVTVKSYTYQTYGVTLLDLSISTFQGQRFIVHRNEELSSNLSGSWGIMVINESTAENSGMDNTVAELRMSKEVILECSSDTQMNLSTQRLAYLAFYTNILFQPSSMGHKVGSVITAALLNCSSDSLLSPITVTYNLSNERVSNLVQCASWKRGQWTTTPGCETSEGNSEDLLECNCYQASYFGVLIILNSSSSTTFQAYVYFAIVLSSVLLLPVLISLLGIRLIRSIEVIVLLHLCIMLQVVYFLFLLGAHIMSISALCGVNAGLLQLLTLVFFSLMTVNSVVRCFHLFTHCGLSQEKTTLLVKLAVIASWIIPMIIVGITASVWPKNYVSVESFCGVVDYPLWYGLFLPLAIISIFHISINVLLLNKTICKMFKRDNSQHQMNSTVSGYSIIVLNIMCPVFYLGFVCGLLSTYPELEGSQWIQVLFTVCTALQGPLFLGYISCSLAAVRNFWKKFLCCKTSEISTCISGVCRPCDCPQWVTTNNGRREESGDTFISTRTNEAYETVVLRRKKDEYIMTENTLYDYCLKQK